MADAYAAELAQAVNRQQAGDLAGAEAIYRRLIAAGAEQPAPLANLAAILRGRAQFDEAEALLRRALDVAPQIAGLWRNLGNLLHEVERLDAAEAAYRGALARAPGDRESRLGLARVLLSLGRCREGFQAMEARPERERAVARGLTGPEWRGESLAGKRLLIWPEQGFGDHLMMLRFLPRLEGQVTMVIMPQLMRLAEPLGAALIPHAAEVRVPAFDYWTLPFSLPIWLMADDADVAAAPVLGGTPRRRGGVGIAWRGNALPDPGRSLPSDLAAELLAMPGAVSLDPADTGAADFQDTADLIAGLDLVVSIDTAVAHLAGAMGKPAWVLRPHRPPEWRWRVGPGDRAAWYPTARVLTQPAQGDWRSVVDRVRAEWPIGG